MLCLGPKTDHTSGNGQFINIETKSPTKPKDLASMHYKFPKQVAGGCFSMYYHMHGKDVGSLTVKAIVPNVDPVKLWYGDGSMVGQWRKVLLTVPKDTSAVGSLI